MPLPLLPAMCAVEIATWGLPSASRSTPERAKPFAAIWGSLARSAISPRDGAERRSMIDWIAPVRLLLKAGHHCWQVLAKVARSEAEELADRPLLAVSFPGRAVAGTERRVDGLLEETGRLDQLILN